jgi:hypothetical protein
VQILVSHLEAGVARLAMAILEPMLSAIKSHTLRSTLLNRSSVLPVLTLVLVTKTSGAASPSPQALIDDCGRLRL